MPFFATQPRSSASCSSRCPSGSSRSCARPSPSTRSRGTRPSTRRSRSSPTRAARSRCTWRRPTCCRHAPAPARPQGRVPLARRGAAARGGSGGAAGARRRGRAAAAQAQPRVRLRLHRHASHRRRRGGNVGGDRRRAGRARQRRAAAAIPGAVRRRRRRRPLPCASTAAGSSDTTPRRRAPCSLAPSLQQRTRDHGAWSQPQKTCVRETPGRLAVASQIIPSVSTRLDVSFTPCACARRRRARVHLFINLHPFLRLFGTQHWKQRARPVGLPGTAAA